jgi:hypothetical protein
MSALETLADGIFQYEFDSDTNTATYDSILGWLKENLGLLNTLINTNFDGIDAALLNEEQAIYKQLYLYNFYSKQARNVLRGIIGGGGVAGDNILSVKDGDNAIQFTNKNEISKVYRTLAVDCKKLLDDMVAKYNIYGAKPLQVGGYEAILSDSSTLSPTQVLAGQGIEALVDAINILSSQGNSPSVTLDGGSDD